MPHFRRLPAVLSALAIMAGPNAAAVAQAPGTLPVAADAPAPAFPVSASALPAIDPAVLGLARASVVRVTSPFPGRISSGSGVVLDPSTVLTNCHVTGASGLANVSPANVVFPGSVRIVDPYLDLCVVHLARPSPLPSITRRAAPGAQAGEPVFTIGYTLGHLSFSRGIVDRVATTRSGDPVLVVSAPFNSGASGGALIDVQGRLVGVTTAVRVDRRTDTFLAVGVDESMAQRALHPWRSIAMGPAELPFWAVPPPRREPFLDELSRLPAAPHAR